MKLDSRVLAEMEKPEMIDYLKDKGVSMCFKSATEDELRDLIIDKFAKHCIELHSEVRDSDYSILHPDETVEEYESHEDHEPRD